MYVQNLAYVGLAENNSKKFHINASDIMKRNDGKVRRVVLGPLGDPRVTCRGLPHGFFCVVSR